MSSNRCVSCLNSYQLNLETDVFTVARVQSITLAIVMELCRYGTLYKIIEYARRVSYMPADVRSGRINPRNAEETKLKARASPPLCFRASCSFGNPGSKRGSQTSGHGHALGALVSLCRPAP